MMNLLILLISCIIAFFLKIIDIKEAFTEFQIELTLLDSLKVLFAIINSFLKMCTDKRIKSKDKIKLVKLLLLHFNRILTFLGEFTVQTMNALNLEKAAMVSVKSTKRNAIKKVIKESIPLVFDTTFTSVAV